MSSVNGNYQHESSDSSIDLESDDFSLLNFDAFNSSTFFNNLIGIGNEKYDTSLADEITTQETLGDSVIINLYRNSAICQRIVNVYPEEASFGHPIFGGTKYRQYGVDQQKIEAYLNDILEKANCPNLESLFRSVSKSARLFGVAYLVLGFNDNEDYSKPLEENKIKSLDWIIQKNKFELTPDNILNPRYYWFNNRYQLYEEPRILESKIHASRVLKFVGVSEVSEVLEVSQNHDSVIQKVIQSLIREDKGLSFGNQLLLKKAILFAKLRLQQAVNTEQKNIILQEKLRHINQVASIYRMIGLNQDEDLGALQIDLGNVDKILSANLERLVAVSGLNRFKLLGSPASEGLGQSSRGLENRLDFSQRSQAYSKAFWRDHLIRIYRLVCKTQNSPTNGKMPSGLDIQFPTNLQIFPDEWAELRNNNATWAEKLINLGVIPKSAVTVAFFGSVDLESQLVPNLVIDDQFVEQLKKEETKPLIEETTGVSTEDSKQFDSYYLVYYNERTTCYVCSASSSSEARSKGAKHRPNLTVKKARLATESEVSQIRKGIWIRTRSDGKSPSESNQKSKIRPHFFKDEYDNEWDLEMISNEDFNSLFCEQEFLESKNLDAVIFTDKKLHALLVAEAKKKFDVYPSWVAGQWIASEYKKRYIEKHGNTKGAYQLKDEGEIKLTSTVKITKLEKILADLSETDDQDIDEAMRNLVE